MGSVGHLWRKQLGLGVWGFRVPWLGAVSFFALVAAGDWVMKGSFLPAWAAPYFLHVLSCSYAYGRGTAVGPQSGKRCWTLLAGLWRAIAPLMKPWCAEGELPTAANLNLHRRRSSHVGWQSDDEPWVWGAWRNKAHRLSELWNPGFLQMEG